MNFFRAAAHCLKEYPLLTVIGVFSTLHTLGDVIARQIYCQPDYVFGDAATLLLSSAEKAALEFGDLTASTLRKLFGHDARQTAAFEEVIRSFFRQAKVLLQRCVDRGFLTVDEAEAGAYSDGLGGRVRLGIAAAVLLSAAVRSADDASAARAERLVMAGGKEVIERASVPAAMQEALSMVLEAKKQLSTAHPSVEDRLRLCHDLARGRAEASLGARRGITLQVRAAIDGDGGTGADALAGVLLRRAAGGLRDRLGERYDTAMDDVFVSVIEDRYGTFDDNAMSEHLVPESHGKLLTERPAQPGNWYHA